MKRYRTIVADPPWPYPGGFATGGDDNPHRQDRAKGAKCRTSKRRHLSYAAMSIDQITLLPVDELAASDARLFLWVTNRYLPLALEIVSTWGFSYRQLIVWDKTPNVSPLSGGIAPLAAEYLIVAARGSPGMGERWASSVIRVRKPRTEHSRKPDAFLDLVEQVSPGPYLELFARRARFGWDYYGDESLGTAELPKEAA